MSVTATPSNGLEIRFLRALHGPNIWSMRPVLEMQVDACNFVFDGWDAADELLCSQGIAGTRVIREALAHAEAMPAVWLGAVAVKLQTAGQTPVAFHAWRPASTPHIVRLAVEFEEEISGKAAIDFATRWINALARHERPDLAREWETFCDLAYDARIGNSTGPTVEAASARGIPFLRLDSESLVQLGHGCRQRRIRRAATDRTSFIANDISTDKQLTKTLLAETGIPVPRGRAVSTAQDACLVARQVGWPVVVKPQDADYGNGVTMRITSEDEVRRAYALARQWSEGVLVEQHVAGHLFRLLVVGGRLVAAVRREPWFVVGDGEHTLLELIEIANHDPRRGAECVSPFQSKLRETGEMPVLTDDTRPHHSVPDPGETVLLRHDVYLKCGGMHLDQTDSVHPEIAAMAMDATSIVGLDIAGLDVIALDLTKSPQEQDFVVLEVNSEPSIALHLEPLCTPSRPVGAAIVDALFPVPEAGRIPVIAVLGKAGDFPVARQVAMQQQAKLRHVGLASRDGAWLNDRPLGVPCQSVGKHTRRLWCHPRTEGVVIHLTLEDVLLEGLPFDRCDELIECPADSPPPGVTMDACPEDLRLARDCVRAAWMRRTPTP